LYYICTRIKDNKKKYKKIIDTMKNTKTILVGAMMAMTIAVSTNANNVNAGQLYSATSADEKIKVTGANNVLPASLPVLETPAPQSVKITNDTNKHSAEQKAAIVGLQLKSSTK
jgi:hypothetical protein